MKIFKPYTITNARMGDDNVDKDNLHVGSGSINQSVAGSGTATFTLNEKSFAPNCSTNSYFLSFHIYLITLQTGVAPKFLVQNSSAGSAYNARALWEYMTATDKPFMFFTFNKDDLSEPVGLWAADDPPNHLWGKTTIEKTEDNPIIIYDNIGTKENPNLVLSNNVTSKYIFNYKLQSWTELKAKAVVDKIDIFDLLKKDYEISADKIDALKNGGSLKTKNLSQV